MQGLDNHLQTAVVGLFSPNNPWLLQQSQTTWMYFCTYGRYTAHDYACALTTSMYISPVHDIHMSNFLMLNTGGVRLVFVTLPAKLSTH
jgi:hypothetical protein